MEQLGLGYNRWKMQHGIGLPAVNPAPALPTLKADVQKATPKLKRAPKQAGKKVRAQ
jgi:hypothetical protein